MTFFDGVITKIGDAQEENLANLPDDVTVFPAFIDEHIHGAGGNDVMDGSVDGLKNIAKTLLQEGTTCFLATTMTQSKPNILKALRAARDYKRLNYEEGAEVLGVHLEGPYISEKYAGAQPKEFIAKPTKQEFLEYYNASEGLIKIVTLAPEEVGCDFIEYIKRLEIIPSVGHSDAKRKDMKEALSCGLSSVTHTFNAQTPLHHRDIGVVGSSLYEDELYCEVICDTVHVSPSAIKLLIKTKPKDKIILITDAMRAKGCGDCVSELGGQKVVVSNGEARLLSGALAGSVLKMNDAIKNLVNLNVPLLEAIDFATKNPAIHLGVYDKRGSVAVGKIADFVLLDKDFNVYRTIKNGKVVYKR